MVKEMNLTALRGLTQFKEREGHSRVPLDHTEKVATPEGGEDVELGKFVRDLRASYRKGELQPYVIEQIEALDFQWSPRGPRSDQSRNSEIRKMREDGKSLTEIAEHFGITRQRVFQIVGKSQ
jgi:DNA-directed RNA polymerase sigma subunit (sigma70/sigma32)